MQYIGELDTLLYLNVLLEYNELYNFSPLYSECSIREYWSDFTEYAYYYAGILLYTGIDCVVSHPGLATGIVFIH